MEDLVKIVKEQFEDSVEITLESYTKFKELDSFDSLTGMCIIVAIKDEFGVEISETEFRAVNTVQDLYQLIQK